MTMTAKHTEPAAEIPVQEKSLVDEWDDPQTRPDTGSETAQEKARENAATSLDQPSDGVE